MVAIKIDKLPIKKIIQKSENIIFLVTVTDPTIQDILKANKIGNNVYSLRMPNYKFYGYYTTRKHKMCITERSFSEMCKLVSSGVQLYMDIFATASTYVEITSYHIHNVQWYILPNETFHSYGWETEEELELCMINPKFNSDCIWIDPAHEHHRKMIYTWMKVRLSIIDMELRSCAM